MSRTWAALLPRQFQACSWKNGSRLSEAKRKSVRENFVDRLKELDQLPDGWGPRKFLERFSKGGAIWRIFWLHCVRREFPIFDQHVYRAMAFIQTGQKSELQIDDERKIDLYIECYLPFHAQFGDIDPRQLDQALWTFGKFIKTWRIVET